VSVDVSVVIVTYNSEDVIPACLSSLREHTRRVSYDVTVVDNASSDGTLDAIRGQFPWVQLIHRPTNGGLSRGVNDGIAASCGRHILALNPDTRFDHDAIAVLSRYLDANPDAGVVAPKLLDDDGALQLSCRRFPGYSSALFSRYSVLTKLVPGNPFSRRYLMSDFDHAHICDVDWVSGAAMMFPRAIVEQLGGWDAGFFMFSEDVDFCQRVHAAGYRVVYNPEARLYHRIGVSKRANARLVIARHRSMWRYYRKHLRGGALRDALTGAAIAARCALMLLGNGMRRLVERASR